MPHQFDSWESYFYPETYNAQTRNGVLRNIPDIRDAAALRTYDYRCCCNLGREPRKLRFYCVINAMCLCCQAVSNTRLTITASGFG